LEIQAFEHPPRVVVIPVSAEANILLHGQALRVPSPLKDQSSMTVETVIYRYLALDPEYGG
jgi:hypothetical protein